MERNRLEENKNNVDFRQRISYKWLNKSEPTNFIQISREISHSGWLHSNKKKNTPITRFSQSLIFQKQSSYSSVHLGKIKSTQQPVACKICHIFQLREYMNAPVAVSWEVLFHKVLQLQHPNLLLQIESFISESSHNINDWSIWIVYEYMDYGTLSRLESHLGSAPPPESMVAYLARSVISGLKYLHEHGIYHGDIKPDNILINHLGDVKIGIFRKKISLHSRNLSHDME